MLRSLRGALAALGLESAVALAAIGWGMATLQASIETRRADLEELDALVTEATFRAARATPPPEAYEAKHAEDPSEDVATP